MRATASIVIPAWNSWSLTQACLESLRPTLGVRDQVVVVDNGSVDDTAACLRRYSWVTVVTHAEPQPLQDVLDSGAAVSTGEIVVFLDNDTLVPSRWLDGLLAPFADPTVGAAGPRSNHVLGPQLVDVVDYDPARPADVGRFARAWRAEHQGRTTDVTQLAGFCLAVRRELLQRVGRGGGTGAGAEQLCDGLARLGYRRVVAHGTFVHRAGAVDWFELEPNRPGTGAPLISASLIVKNEEAILQTCLDSLVGFADEVVVYDTGSTDGTVALARAAGALVVEGYWDDDFGRARNASLDSCTGEWIFVVDADEALNGDLIALRRQVAAARVDAITMQIDNADDQGGVTFSHHGTRLFRRARARWHGRLHEQVVPRNGRPLVHETASQAAVRHIGYTAEMMEQRQKNARNERVARRAAEATGGQDPLALVNLGRALGAVGKHDEALETFSRARRLTTNPGLLRQALRSGADLLLDSGRPEEALEWIGELRRNSTSTTMADYLEGLARTNLLDTAGALECFARIDQACDEDFTVSQHLLHLRRGLSLADSERWGEAAGELLLGVRGRRVTEPVWAFLVEAHWRSGRPMRDVLDVVEDGHLLIVLGQLLNASAPAGDAFAECAWEKEPGDPRLLAYAIQMAPRLPLPKVLEWAARLRAAGLESQCPLVQLVEAPTAPALDRVRAAAIALEAFGDTRGAESLEAAAAALEPAEFCTALLAVDELSPRLLPAVVLGASTTRARSLAMADALRSLGAVEQADELVSYAPA